MTKEKKDVKKKIKLSVEKRKVFGKKLKKLRRKDILPANIYGEGFKSTAISVSMKNFIKIYKTAGETQVVYIKINGQELPTIIHNLQKHPLTDMPLHTDFRKVSLKKKIETEVPIKLIGESEGITQKKGDLLTLKDELMVSALPDSIPQYIEVDITPLKEVDDEITIKNLKATGNYEIINEPDTIIVKIASHKEEAVEEPKAEEEEIEGESEEEKEGDEKKKEEAGPTEEGEGKPEKQEQGAGKTGGKPEQKKK